MYNHTPSRPVPSPLPSFPYYVTSSPFLSSVGENDLRLEVAWGQLAKFQRFSDFEYKSIAFKDALGNLQRARSNKAPPAWFSRSESVKQHWTHKFHEKGR